MSEIINPQDAELEEIILGSCLIESKAITLIADILRPEAFYNEKNLEIYATLQSMYRNGQKIDIITVKEELARRGKLEFIGGPYTLAHISGRVASSAHLGAGSADRPVQGAAQGLPGLCDQLRHAESRQRKL